VTSLVVGAGRSGVALARFLSGSGERVRVIDSKSAPELEHTLSQLVPGVEVSVGGYDESVLAGVDSVYASPGVPWDSELLNRARERGIAVSSEIDLFLRRSARHRRRQHRGDGARPSR
jgi:UDP-N-acetylmuramoylalanine--D-glutamate ligase